MEAKNDDPRRDLILQAAFKVFVTYGFRRTSMSDIATAAGLSRPALYQHFDSKADIFRAYVVLMKETTLQAISAAFAGDGAFRDKLTAALDGAFLSPHRLISDSPHGDELLGVNKEIASDLFVDWMGGAEAAFAEALATEVQAGRLDFTASGLDPARLARLIIDTMEGIKMRMTSLGDAERAIADLVRLVAAAVGR
ncbi:TetR/AcrR family transcriptional regulator [Mycoplana rhizolycopersici]|uniref:TetR/AcrR family transcriptional regulator n=1 Tax=Mycoplana rhizolycopersici TaxID=2746702 RepID=A0ABX2Q855_9HYPH|nr:TetR/AcrR family transcriptional regulator [Rhizobium rhizolycopersici]NVP53887.1 TetR/AcrR family transcriptional regulator [Rhizobium rhizolycopersici]